MTTAFVRQRGNVFNNSPKSTSVLGYLTSVLSRFLFSNPFRSFAILILLVGVPISVYISVLKANSISEIRSFAVEPKIDFSICDPKVVTVGEEFFCQLNIEAEYAKTLTLEEIAKPEWLNAGESIESDLEGNTKYYGKDYTGVVSDGEDMNLAFLAKAEGGIEVGDCKGCDQDVGTYSFKEFVLPVEQCIEKRSAVRNPVNGECDDIIMDCYAPQSWNSYSTLEQCKNIIEEPEMLISPRSEMLDVNIDCNGIGIINYSGEFLVLDSDGEIVRYDMVEPLEKITLEQDSVRDIVKSVSTEKEVNYEDFEYSSGVAATFSNQDIGKTFFAKVNACDAREMCVEKKFNLMIKGELRCEDDSSITNVELIYPNEEELLTSDFEVKWIVDSSSKPYEQRVEIWDETCSKKRVKLYEGGEIEQSQNGIWSVNAKIENLDDGKYCVKVLSKDSEYSYWIADKSDNSFSVKTGLSDLHFQELESHINITTGEQLNFLLKTNNDKSELAILSSPEWITLEGSILKGSTTIPGSYLVDAKASLDKDISAQHELIINVNPPANIPTQIEILKPTKNSVFRGESNEIVWDIDDSDGIDYVSLKYIRLDSKVNETKEIMNNKEVVSYIWDVSGIDPGLYRLILTVSDNSEEKVENSKFSEVVYIAPSSKSNERTILPSVVKSYPPADSDIFGGNLLLGGLIRVAPSDKLSENNIQLYLDDKELPISCNVEKNSVECIPDSELELGRHKINLQYIKGDDVLLSETWFFNVQDLIRQNDPVSTVEEIITNDQQNHFILIPFTNIKMNTEVLVYSGAIILAALFLLIVPWTIYFMWRKKEKKASNQDGDVSKKDKEAKVASAQPADQSSTLPDLPPLGEQPTQASNSQVDPLNTGTPAQQSDTQLAAAQGVAPSIDPVQQSQSGGLGASGVSDIPTPSMQQPPASDIPAMTGSSQSLADNNLSQDAGAMSQDQVKEELKKELGVSSDPNLPSVSEPQDVPQSSSTSSVRPISETTVEEPDLPDESVTKEPLTSESASQPLPMSPDTQAGDSLPPLGGDLTGVTPSPSDPKTTNSALGSDSLGTSTPPVSLTSSPTDQPQTVSLTDTLNTQPPAPNESSGMTDSPLAGQAPPAGTQPPQSPLGAPPETQGEQQGADNLPNQGDDSGFNTATKIEEPTSENKPL